MQQQKPYAVVVLVLGLALGVLRAVDLLFWSDAAGFALVGPYWLRLAVWAAALLLPYLAGRAATAQPAALRDRCPLLGGAMLLTAVPLVGAGLAAAGALGVTAWGLTAWLDILFPLVAGLWLLYYGVRAFGGYGIHRAALGHALPGLALPLYFGWQLIYALEIKPAAMQRLPNSLQVLAAAAALLFAAALLKVFLTPGNPCGNTLFSAGSGCYLLCTCVGLPQTVVGLVRGQLGLAAACAGFAAAAFGLCGLLCAFAAMGPDADSAEEK